MMADFLTAWLIEGNAVEAMSYVSPRSYACLAEDNDDPFTVDCGIAPFVISRSLKAAHDAIGQHASLEGLTTGCPTAAPGPAGRRAASPRAIRHLLGARRRRRRVRLRQPAEAGRPETIAPPYATYSGATFNINTPNGRQHSMALLWAREDGYWKIVSWKAEPAGDDTSPQDASPLVKTVRSKLTTPWWPRPGISSRAGCSAGTTTRRSATCRRRHTRATTCCGARQPGRPLPKTRDGIRAALERAGDQFGKRRSVDEFVEGVQPFHESIRVMEHRYSRTFALYSVPTSSPRPRAARIARAAAASPATRSPSTERVRHERAIQNARRRGAGAASALVQGVRRVAHHRLRRRDALILT